jgi:nicotinamide-nucleotide amidase
MNTVIISIGSELLTGQCLDTNTAWLSAQLVAVGLEPTRHVTVGDDLDALVKELSLAFREAAFVVLTGGLGPTVDDLTREAVARALGVSLDVSAEALGQIERFLARWGRVLSDANRTQAMVPADCSVLENRWGTAPGLTGRTPAGLFHALPGVPAEMKAMFEAYVLPDARRLAGGAVTLVDRLCCFGMAESTLGETIKDLMRRGRTPSVGTTASGAIISVRVVVQAPSVDQARELLEADLAEVRRRLGSVVFGRGDATLQQAVGEALLAQKLTIATAESCTGGLVAKRLTDVPGSSAYLLEGFVTYANAAKIRRLGVSAELIDEFGAVSEEVAGAMASGCREAAGSDLALAVTGIAGPGGGQKPEKPVGLVYIALADGLRVDARKFTFGEHLSRIEIRDRSCKTALNLLRLRLLGSG